jgi:hypothetical protein
MASDSADRLTLTKWYLDCADPTGRVAIAYWATLAWRHLAFTWHSIVLRETDGTMHRRAGLAEGGAPIASRGAIRWHAPALGCSQVAEPRQSAVAIRLFHGPSGSLEWHCEAPAAMVSVEAVGHAPMCGPGYAERLVLTMPPWRLPIRKLRWGRWLDPDAKRSVVWIDWNGPCPASWVLVDGRLAPKAAVDEASVRSPGFALVLDRGRTLEARGLGDTLGAIPGLRNALPASFLALRQTRWLARGTFKDGGARAVPGQAIHELVVFK